MILTEEACLKRERKHGGADTNASHERTATGKEAAPAPAAAGGEGATDTRDGNDETEECESRTTKEGAEGAETPPHPGAATEGLLADNGSKAGEATVKEEEPPALAAADATPASPPPSPPPPDLQARYDALVRSSARAAAEHGAAMAALRASLAAREREAAHARARIAALRDALARARASEPRRPRRQHPPESAFPGTPADGALPRSLPRRRDDRVAQSGAARPESSATSGGRRRGGNRGQGRSYRPEASPQRGTTLTNPSMSENSGESLQSLADDAMPTANIVDATNHSEPSESLEKKKNFSIYKDVSERAVPSCAAVDAFGRSSQSSTEDAKPAAYCISHDTDTLESSRLTIAEMFSFLGIACLPSLILELVQAKQNSISEF